MYNNMDKRRSNKILDAGKKSRRKFLQTLATAGAAVTTAWPAATSHSEVGARRG